MRAEWPLLLAAAAFFMGASARYISTADGGSDVLSAILATLGAAAFGAWLYSLGAQALHEREKERNE